MKKNILRGALSSILAAVIAISPVSVMSVSVAANEPVPVVRNDDPWDPARKPAIDAARLIWMDPSKTIEERVDALLGVMTLQEKVGQTVQLQHEVIFGAPGTLIELANVSSSFMGSMLYPGHGTPAMMTAHGNTWMGWLEAYNRMVLESLKTPLQIPLLVEIDAVHGTSHSPGTTILPHIMSIGAAVNRDESIPDSANDAVYQEGLKFAESLGRITALESRALEYYYNFNPCIPLAMNVRWGRTHEGFSQDAQFEGEVGAAYAVGFQGGRPAEGKWDELHTPQTPDNQYGFFTDPAPLYDEGFKVSFGATVKHFFTEGYTVNGGNAGGGYTWVYDFNIPELGIIPGGRQPMAINAEQKATANRGGGVRDMNGMWELYNLTPAQMLSSPSVAWAFEPYRISIENGVRSFMPSFHAFNGIRLHEFKAAYDVLKLPRSEGGMGFTGFVVGDYRGHASNTYAPSNTTANNNELDRAANLFFADAVTKYGFGGNKNYNDSNITSQQFRDANVINAGMDLMMLVSVDEIYGTSAINTAIPIGQPGNTGWFATQLMNVMSGRVSEERLDDAVRRVLRVKFELGLFENPFPMFDKAGYTDTWTAAEQNAKAFPPKPPARPDQRQLPTLSGDALTRRNQETITALSAERAVHDANPAVQAWVGDIFNIAVPPRPPQRADWNNALALAPEGMNQAQFTAANDEAFAAARAVYDARTDVIAWNAALADAAEAARPMIRHPESLKIAREAVRRSLVLLKNDNAILDTLHNLDPNKILVAGRFANRIGWQLGSWTREWQGEINKHALTTTTTWNGQRNDWVNGIINQTPTAPPEGWKPEDGLLSTSLGNGGHYIGTNLLEGIAKVVPGFNKAQFTEDGTRLASHEETQFDDGVIILAVGETPYAEGNGDAGLIATYFNGNRLTGNLQLHPEDYKTLQNLKAAYPDAPIVMLGYFGRPMILENVIDDVDAFVSVWWPGTEGGEAIAEMLFDNKYDFTGTTKFPWAWYPEWIGNPAVLAEKAESPMVNMWEIGAGLKKAQTTHVAGLANLTRPPRQVTPIQIGDVASISGTIYTHSNITNIANYVQSVYDKGGYLASTAFITGGTPVDNSILKNGTTESFFAGGPAWVEYLVNVQEAGTYHIGFSNSRAAAAAGQTAQNDNAVKIYTRAKGSDRDDPSALTILQTYDAGPNIPSKPVTLAQGEQVLRFEIDPKVSEGVTAANSLQITSINFRKDGVIEQVDLDVESIAAGHNAFVTVSLDVPNGYVARLMNGSNEVTTANFTNGSARLVIPATGVENAGTYQVTVREPNIGTGATATPGRLIATEDISVIAYSNDLWVMRVALDSNLVFAEFADDVEIASGATATVTVNGVVTATGTISPSASANRVNVSGFNDSAIAGAEDYYITISGIIFPNLFPGYEFTFTVLY